MSDDPNSNSHRCSACDVNWPFTAAYLACALCHEPTWISARTRAMSVDEARLLVQDVTQARVRRAAFEKYYREHAVETCSICLTATTIVTAPDLDGRYALCVHCDRGDPELTADQLGGWDS